MGLKKNTSGLTMVMDTLMLGQKVIRRGKAGKMTKSYIEHQHQAALFKWRDLQIKVYPQLKWMYATVNSAKLTQRQGKWLKAEGKRKGVWDVFLPYPNGKYGGLWLEMKAGKNGLTDDQKEFREDLKDYYCFAVCYSAKEAEDSIIKYLGVMV